MDLLRNDDFCEVVTRRVNDGGLFELCYIDCGKALDRASQR